MDKPVSRGVALLVVTMASFLTPFMATAVTIALPTIAKEFGLDAVTLGWVATAYMLASAVTLLPAGRLADICGRKRMFAAGTLVFGLSSLVISVAPSASSLIGARVLQGIGGAMMFSTSAAILMSVYPAKERGRVLGLNVASVYTGQSVGPTVGGLLTHYFGWRSIFLLVGPLGILVCLLTIWRLRSEWAEARGEAFDVGGSVVYGVSLMALITGLSALPGVRGLALIIAAAVGFVGFVLWEQRTGSPVLNMALFRGNRVFAFSNAAALINYCANAATAFLLSLYLQQIKALTPQEAGVILISQPVVQAVFSPITGRLSDSVEPRLLASVGMGCAALGLFLFAFLSPETPIGLIVPVLMLLGLGFALFSSPNTNAIMSSVDRRFYGVSSATTSTMRVVGQTLSIGIVMLVFAVHIGRVALGPENLSALMTSMRILFAFFATLCVTGIFFSLTRGNVR